MKQQITQAELRTVLDVYNQSLEMADKLQRRLQDGAEVEPGKFAVENEYAQSLEEFTPTVTLAIGGLDIKPVSEAAPDWLTETPEDLSYKLEVWDPDTTVQEITLTRGEYIALKHVAAKMRGYAVTEVAHA